MDTRCPPHTPQIFSGSTLRELEYRFPKGQVVGKSYGTNSDAIGNMLGEHIDNLRNMLRKHWELDGNTLVKT
jgi:hypothetical protein